MKVKKSKGLLISAIIVGILTILGVVGVAGTLFIALNGYGIKIEDSVYFKQSDLIVNYSQTNPDQIESYTVKIVNTTNKEFIDYEVRLTLYIINGMIEESHYPHASTPTQIVSIKPKEEKVITLNAGFLTGIDLEGYTGESLELEYQAKKEEFNSPSYFNQIKNGKDFVGGVQQAQYILCGLAGFELLVCLIVEIILIVKYNKSGKKLIKEMISKK